MQPSPRTPSESGPGSRRMPSRSSGRRNAVMPRPRAPGCVAAKTIPRLAASALATQTLRPDSRQPTPSGVAIVCWLAASVPAFSSDSANTPSASPVASRRSHSACCASVPKRRSDFGDQRVAHAQDDGDGRTGACDGLDRQRVRHVIVPQPAVLARDGDPEQPPRSRLPHQRHAERHSTRRSRPPSAQRARVRTPRPPRGRPPAPGSVRGAWEQGYSGGYASRPSLSNTGRSRSALCPQFLGQHPHVRPPRT